MEMTHVELTPAMKLVLWFCLFWPFLAMSSIPRRGRSSAPIAAALVALAVIACLVWIELAGIVEGARLAGLNRETSIAIARQTFSVAWLAVWPIGWIAVLSLIRRHWPIPDGFVVALTALLCVAAIAALNFVAFLSPRMMYMIFARAAAAFALAIALAAAVWLFVVTRRPTLDSTQ